MVIFMVLLPTDYSKKEDFVYGADGQIEKIIVIYNGTARTTYKQSSEYPVYQVHYEDGNKLIFSPR